MKKLFLLFCFIFFSINIIPISCFRRNSAPDIPSKPDGTSLGKIGLAYDFTTSCNDPDDDSVAYQFDWGDSDTSNWSIFAPNGVRFTRSHSWSSIGTYIIKARAKDKHNKISGWSEGLQIIITDNSPPQTPSMPSGPFSGLVNLSYAFSSVTTDPDNDSIAYRFDWGNGDTSNWSLYYASGMTISLTQTYNTAGLYSIRVQAKDIRGTTSEWSSALIFPVLAFPIRISLTWGAEPRDLDAHFWTPQIQGQNWHIYWANPGHLNTAPYCTLDNDAFNGFGPEQITITQLLPGTYKYGVHHYDGDSTVTTSNAAIKFYYQDQLLLTLNIPNATSQPNWWWYAFNLDGATGIITPVNTIGPNPPSYIEKVFFKKR